MSDYPHEVGEWTLVSPSGKTWKADAPLLAAAAELRDRIPATVRLGRILDSDAEYRSEQIKRAVDRFLGWKLPRDFWPDGGVSFSPFGTHDTHSWPIGTNILTAEQARQMFEHCLPDE